MKKNMANFDAEYLANNPQHKVSSFDEIVANVPRNNSKVYTENVTSDSKRNLIKRVFENKAKSLIDKSRFDKFDDGGDANAKSVYTPYEFLHELLPKVYESNGYPRYIVSDSEGDEIYNEIAEKRNALEQDIASILEENGADNIYELEPSEIDKINKRRSDLENQEIFITESELEAYLLTNPNLKQEDYVKKIKHTIPELLDRGLVCVDYNNGDLKYVYKYQYVSGNIYDKLSELQRFKDRFLEFLTNEQWDYQFELLQKHKNPLSRISLSDVMSIYLHPFSHFCTDNSIIKLNTEDFVDWENCPTNATIQVAFILWIDYAVQNGILLPKDFKGSSKENIKNVFAKNDISSNIVSEIQEEAYSSSTDEKTAKTKIQRSLATMKEKAQKVGEPIFVKFLNEALTVDARQRIELVWNAKYNAYVLPVLHKTPVALRLSRRFKDNREFIPNPTQIQSIQFMNSAKSGLLAYGVGVGKTASSILNVSYAIENGFSKHPLFVVPLPTYEKWKMEIKGGQVKVYTVKYSQNGEELTQTFDNSRDANKFARKVNGKAELTKQYMSKGLLPHLPNIVDLGNLNWESFVKDNIKRYSTEDLEKIENFKMGLNYIKSLSAKYEEFSERQIRGDYGVVTFPVFDGFSQEEQVKIINFFPFLDLEEFRENYNNYQSLFVPNDKGKIELKKSTKYLPPELLIRGFSKKDIYIPSINNRINSYIYSLGEYIKFPENTIFICTYQALKYLGTEQTDEDSDVDFGETKGTLYSNVYNELSQGDILENVITKSGSDVLSNKIKQSMFGDDDNPKIFLSELGIDYLVVDESHFFKKVFVTAKAKVSLNDELEKSGRFNRRWKKKYPLIGNDSGQPSSRGLSMYILTRYVQNKSLITFNDGSGIGGNVCHLTATPFTNNPIEVYSMMALTNIDFLKKSGFFFIEDFFDAFMKIQFALRYKATSIEKEQVLVGYNNAPQMKSLIFYLMDYKNGEDANIKRPDKYILPNPELNVDTIIRPTDEQLELFQDIKKYIRGKISLEELCGITEDEVDVEELSDTDLVNYILELGTEAQIQKYSDIDFLDELTRKEAEDIVSKILDKQENISEEDLDVSELKMFRTLKGLTYIRQVTLSPYLLQCRKERETEPTFEQYIESSPKLNYTLKCIKSTHDYEDSNNLKRSGVVVYMNMGVHPSAKVPIGEPVSYTASGTPVYGEYITKKWSNSAFEKIKQYLVNKYGYSDSEIVLVKGGMSNAQKESAKNKFLSGKATVLIGSSTISTGVDLQENASSLFLNAFDWNPTDNEQIAGRIHRQGNPFKEVRIVYPMISDSADPIIFQTVQEKARRIAEIWDKKGSKSSLSLDDFDPAKIQEELITDPDDLTELWRERETDSLVEEIEDGNQKLNVLRLAFQTYSDYEKYLIPVRKTLEIIDAFKKYSTRIKGIENTKNKIQEVMLQDYEDKLDKEGNIIESATEIQLKEIQKIKRDSYDYEKDPEGRYIPESYMDKHPDELAKKLRYECQGDNSWFGKLNSWDNRSELDLAESFIRDNYPNYVDGIWLSDDEVIEMDAQVEQLKDSFEVITNELSVVKEERDKLIQLERESDNAEEKQNLISEIQSYDLKVDKLNKTYTIKREELEERKRLYESLAGGETKLSFRADWSSGFINKKLMDRWYFAWKDMLQKTKILESWGLSSSNMVQARVEILNRLEELNSRFDNIERQVNVKRLEFQKRFEESKTTAPSVDELVGQFSRLNERFLGKNARVVVFDIDKTKIVEGVPLKDLKPKVDDEDKVQIEDIEIVEVSDESDTFVDDSSKINQLLDELDGYELLLDMADGEIERQNYLDVIDGYIDLLDLEDYNSFKLSELKNKFGLN